MTTAPNGWQYDKDRVERAIERISGDVSAIREGIGEVRGRVIAWSAIIAILFTAAVNLIISFSKPNNLDAEAIRTLNSRMEEVIKMEQAHKPPSPPWRAGDNR